MKKVLVWFGGAVVGLVLFAGAGFAWASASANSKLNQVFTTHEVEFPVPVPAKRPPVATEGEEGEGETDWEALALEQAIERGRHLINARYACADCHGANLGGGVMVDDPAMGRLLGPNLTTGAGSITLGYTVADWDRIVRHGLRKDGRPALMPSEDFMAMSDQELSDLIAYIRSLPPVDNAVPESTLGPVGKVLVATGKFPLSVDLIDDHERAHRAAPPEAAVTVEFGNHLAMPCTGCHRQNFEGGAIVQGPPDWAPARNLTPHEDGLAAYDFSSFERVMREGIRPDGEKVRAPMDIATTYAANMTDTEMRALWLFFQSLDPIPQGR